MFLDLARELADPRRARFHILPVPFEKTVSYGRGTSRGPQAILDASGQVELFDGHGEPARWGIATHAPLPVTDSDPEEMIRTVAAAVSRVAADDRVPVVLGGEHTVTLGAVEALAARYGDIGVVQFDAHADLRDQFDGSRFSHACVMRRIVEQRLPILQIGVRSLSAPEHRFRIENNVPHWDADVLARQLPDSELIPPDFPGTVYVTFDVDSLDPSIMPATGTPEPGGLDWYTALELLQTVVASRTVVGFDVVELAPIPQFHAADFTAAKLVYALIGMLSRKE